MNRFYLDSDPVAPGVLSLSAEDVHHARDVLRLKPGDTVEVIRNGQRSTAIITELSRERVLLSAGDPLPSTEPLLASTLFQGLPKADKMDWIVQKAVELGVSRIVPVQMERSVVHLKPQDFPRKVERWTKIAREAGKQSGRCVLPAVLNPVSVSQAAALFADLEAAVVPWESCQTLGPLAFTRSHPGLRSLGIVIGPEGGISPAEISLLEKAGCIPMTLGPRILRTETAGLAAVSAFLSLYGEME